jgi:putative aldouronate transport system permease protein
MIRDNSLSRKLFVVFNYILLSLIALTCVLPLIQVIAISFSSPEAATAGFVKLFPVDFTTAAYEYVLGREEFFNSILVTLKRVGIGIPLNMLLTILIAYPLSKESKVFRSRTFYAWLFVITILFNGGLIPLYMVVKATNILDTVWALILPGAVPVFNVILLLNFFRGLPKELEEAAFIDGAGHWTVLWRIYLPLSIPALATITLLTTVMHWNSWFDGLIFMNSPDNYPLQSYMQTTVIQQNTLSIINDSGSVDLSKISDRTARAAQVILGALPILIAYPFLQRFFVKGIVLGSVKE